MYAGTREGFISMFPAWDDPSMLPTCFDFDTRLRPWYTKFSAESDRQVIFMLDRSSSISETVINGEPLSYYTQHFIHRFVEMLKVRVGKIADNCVLLCCVPKLIMHIAIAQFGQKKMLEKNKHL